MGDHKHKSSSSKRHDGTKHSEDVRLGHSSSKDKKNYSKNQNIRWICVSDEEQY